MMLIRLTLLAGFCANVIAAQTPQETPRLARAIDHADTLGANFSVADSSKGKGAPTDWDFLHGMFQFRFQQRNPDGTFAQPFSGHWSGRRFNTTGAMIEDHWRPDVASRTWESGTWTYRVFDPRRQVWTIQGIEPDRGVWQPGVTWSDDANRYVIQHNGPILMRIRYFNITPTSFSWRADRSTDGGQTWIRDWWSMQVTRIGK